MSWISILEEKPPNETSVLASGFDYGNKSNKRHCVVAMYFDGYWYDKDDVDTEFKYITHWMPLPEPPKEN